MFVFEHAEITLGIATVLTGIFGPKFTSATRNASGIRGPIGISAIVLKKIILTPWVWFLALCKFVDLRVLLVGSLLPDILDKPVGLFIFQSTFDNGRIFGHTLLLLLVLTILGIILQLKYHKNTFLVLAFGSCVHLILDSMWQEPRTLFWPIFGFTFEKINGDQWLPNIIQEFLKYPENFIPEIIGAIIGLILAVAMLRKGILFRILRYGKIS